MVVVVLRLSVEKEKGRGVAVSPLSERGTRGGGVWPEKWPPASRQTAAAQLAGERE
ncbi:hypothetical protein HanPI659440_Chr17g0692251 [Helianthus annuus]|nr:hypothetical protein HanPI659440_Chr17g0692251 [Helianthus annuus]